MSQDLATSNRVSLRIVEEDAYGKTPDVAAGHVARAIRFTGESLAFNNTKTESGEIRDDRQTADLIPVGAKAAGGFNFELSYREFDMMIAAALQCLPVVYGEQTPGIGQGIGDVFAADFTATTITHSGPALTGPDAFTTLGKGQWFLVNTGGDINDGKILRTSSLVAPTAGVITLDPSTPAEVGSVVAAHLSSTRYANASLQKSFSIERAHLDVTQFFVFRGMTLSKLSLKIAAGAITTGSFEFMGKDGERKVASYMPGTITPSFGFDVQNGVSGVGYVLEGGVPLADTFVKSLDLTIENTLRERTAIGTLGSVSIGNGSFKVSGTAEVYFKDGTLYDKAIKNKTTSIQIVTKDDSSNGYAFQVPAAKYGDPKLGASGKDQDVMLSLPFTGIIDPITQKMLLIDRYGV